MVTSLDGWLAAQTTATIPWTTEPARLQHLLASREGVAMTIDDFRQRDPRDGEPSSEITQAFLARDARNLYVGFSCLDASPASVRARLSKRDAIGQDDQVIVMLDTFHDHQRAYLFAVNPLGIQADALMAEGKDDDYSFDAVWRSEGRLTQTGFVVLMTIPFKSLRVPADGNGTWGIALSRVMPRRSEQAFWPRVSRRVEGLTQQFAAVEGFTSATHDRNLQWIPYLAAGSARTLDTQSGSFHSQTHHRAGLDAKLVVRDATAVDVAIHPDFSQVESDQPQVAINQRFELFYPEKRPFFLENAALFRYPAVPPTRTLPDTIFFSRRIQDPELGVRATGKLGAWSFGGLVVSDRGQPGAQPDRAVAVVGRVQHEFHGQSSVGLLLTSRTTDAHANEVGTIDLRWKLTPNLVWVGQMMTSRTRERQSNDNGAALHTALLFTSPRVFGTLFYIDRSPSFRAALGFVPRTDMRQIEHYGEYRIRPRRGAVVAWGPNSYVRLNWNYQGTLQEWIVRFPFQIDLKGRTSVFVRRVESFELFKNVALREHVQTINVTTEWLKWLSLNESIEWGSMPNYFPAADARPFIARTLSGSLGLTFRPSPSLRLEETILYSGLRAIERTRQHAPVIFSNAIQRVNVNYQFTRDFSLRAILDYSSVIPNPQLVALDRDKRLGLDALFSYQVGPGTALFVGYNTGFRNVIVPASGGLILPSVSPTTETGRQLMVKLSYLWRT